MNRMLLDRVQAFLEKSRVARTISKDTIKDAAHSYIQTARQAFNAKTRTKKVIWPASNSYNLHVERT